MLVGSPYNPLVRGTNIWLAPFNNVEETRRIVEAHNDELAAIIVEPVAGNMGVIAPETGFLESLRILCDEFHLLLIFDEVMTGFRVAYPGAQMRYKVTPDITCLGKIIGGGLPIGAYGGKSEIMSVVAPQGTKMYQGGTYSGNPSSASAGIAALKILNEDQTYWERLEDKALTLCSAIAESAYRFGIAIRVVVVGGMFTLYFSDEQPRDYESVQQCDVNNFAKFFNGMLNEGIYWPPSQSEAAHISLAHTDLDLEFTAKAANSVFSRW